MTLAFLCRCGSLHEQRGLCPRCRREHERQRGSSTKRGLGADYRRVRAQVLREETRCWLCGQPARLGDPLTADHVVARVDGGTNTRENLRAAHASCNSRRGAGGRFGRAVASTTPDPALREALSLRGRGSLARSSRNVDSPGISSHTRYLIHPTQRRLDQTFGRPNWPWKGPRRALP